MDMHLNSEISKHLYEMQKIYTTKITILKDFQDIKNRIYENKTISTFHKKGMTQTTIKATRNQILIKNILH